MSAARTYLGADCIFLDRIYECQECGAVVGYRGLHDEWHDALIGVGGITQQPPENQ